MSREDTAWLRRMQSDPVVEAQREARRASFVMVAALRSEVHARAPEHWRCDYDGADGSHWLSTISNYPLSMIWSLALEGDEMRPWIHASVSHRKRLPNRDEMHFVKQWVFGPHRAAYEVWPPEDQYVNLREVLHLWGVYSGPEPLPNFAGVTSDGRMTI